MVTPIKGILCFATVIFHLSAIHVVYSKGWDSQITLSNIYYLVFRTEEVSKASSSAVLEGVSYACCDVECSRLPDCVHFVHNPQNESYELFLTATEHFKHHGVQSSVAGFNLYSVAVKIQL